MGRNDFFKVVRDRTLEDGTTWTIPIVLDVDSETASEISPSDTVELYYEDELVGFLDVEEVYKYNDHETARKLFDTDDPDHPGVRQYYNLESFFVGGDIALFESCRYNEFDLLPQESRVLFQQRGWETVVGFQTRNAPHRAHEYIQKVALEQTDGLLIQPKLGVKKFGDYRDEVIMAAYETLIDEYYQRDRVALSVFPSKMRYAGPREAVFDAIVRKNQGCTHFVIGRDHAGVKDYYGSYEAQHVFSEIGDIGIEPVFFDYSFFCHKCDGMASERICPHDESARVIPSGSKIRELLQSADEPSEKMMRAEVVETIMTFSDVFVGDERGGQ
jgi:sulfate adenylyltransferase